MRNNVSKVMLVLILAAGGILRFSGLDWDGGYHLQPDERYISMVAAQLTPPRSLGEYFDPNKSSVSPYIHNFGAYIYGQLPLTAMTYLSRWVGMEGYDRFYLLGRAISAMLDTLSIVLVYKLGRRLWNQRTGVIGAGFYAFSPLAIQYSHFMTMESWLTFSWLILILMMAEVFSGRRLFQESPGFARRFLFRQPLVLTGIVGFLLGGAMAVKASSVVLAPLAVAAILLSFKDSPYRRVRRVLIILVTAVLSFRFFQPTIFASASWLDWSLRQDFYQAFNFQRLAIEGKVMFPPQWQWVDTSRWWFPLKNILLWGMGPAAGGLAVAGIIWQICQIWRIRQIRLKWLIAAWIAAVFFWQGGKFVKNMRYFLPFFPLYALFAAGFIRSLLARQGDSWLGKMVLFVVLVSSGVWAIMFTDIYRQPTTRVAASEWIYKNIPAGSKIMLEEWDDPLPLLMSGYELFNYQTEMVGVYAVDDEKKKEQINRWTRDFDWIVLSSPRAKGSIGELTDEFPIMSDFYSGLDSGKLGFTRVVKFTSVPQFSIFNFQFSIDDSSAEESFWVYDHPKVEIYKKIQNSKFLPRRQAGKT